MSDHEKRALAAWRAKWRAKYGLQQRPPLASRAIEHSQQVRYSEAALARDPDAKRNLIRRQMNATKFALAARAARGEIAGSGDLFGVRVDETPDVDCTKVNVEADAVIMPLYVAEDYDSLISDLEEMMQQRDQMIALLLEFADQSAQTMVASNLLKTVFQGLVGDIGGHDGYVFAMALDNFDSHVSSAREALAAVHEYKEQNPGVLAPPQDGDE